MTRNANRVKLDIMSQINHIKIVQAGRFLKLFKNDAQFATPIFRLNQQRKNLQFVIVFKVDDGDDFYVLNHSQKGYSERIWRVKTFTKTTLYQGMMSVPIKARESIQILQVPSDKKTLKDYITYYNQSQIDELLYGKSRDNDDIYDPFRDAHSAIFHTEPDKDDAMIYEDYQGIQDFHPFLAEADSYLPLSCTYNDPKRGISIEIQLMGWYYLGQQLKISWKPANRSHARWRSSIVAIDRKTRRYFFQGNIYQAKGTDPVFLDYLTFIFQDIGQNSRAAQAEFDRFIQEIKAQERMALLKLR